MSPTGRHRETAGVLNEHLPACGSVEDSEIVSGEQQKHLSLAVIIVHSYGSTMCQALRQAHLCYLLEPSQRISEIRIILFI